MGQLPLAGYAAMLLTNVNNVVNNSVKNEVSNKAVVNPFATATQPIVELINMAAGPLLGIIAALGTLYCIFLGVKLAKAEEPQEREKAKGALKNAIIGFVLIFVLIAALNLMMDPLLTWMNASGKTTISIK